MFGVIMETYSEEEQVEKLKEWWKRNGTALVLGVLLGGGLVLGNNLWQSYRQGKAEEASSLYEQMMVSYSEKKPELAETVGGKLIRDFTHTPYAAKAALFLAKVSYESGDSASARSQLKWAMANGKDEATVHTARLRLAHLLQEAGKTDEALKLLDVKEQDGFRSAYAETRADLLLAQGDVKGAADGYRKALETLPKGSTYGDVLRMKLDDLGLGETKK
jgi:predicted negative regulator of RcsB-dependent stress response